MVLHKGFIAVYYETSTMVNDVSIAFVQNLGLVYIEDIS